MCRKMIYTIYFALLLCLTLTSITRAELVGWWKLDEGAGNIAYDSSGNDNNGTIEGTAQWAEGKIGGAWLGNGTNAFIRIPHSESLMIDDAITITCWFYHTAAPADMIICKSDGTGQGWQSNYAIRLDDQGPRRVNWRGRSTVNQSLTSTALLPQNEWIHIACTFDITTSKNRIYINGVLDSENTSTQPLNPGSRDLYIGADQYPANTPRWWFQGMLDDVRIYNTALLADQIMTIMQGGGAAYPLASRPSPADGAHYEETWVSVGWQPGDFAVSHDVYFGDNFDDVNDGTRDSEVFRGNQNLNTTFYFAGFAPGAYPEGLVNGSTYYWRIDEVNDADPNSPWKGKVWSFTVPPKTAYNPSPAEGAEFVNLNVRLTWTAGIGAKIHYIVFGEDFDEVNDTAMGILNGSTSYSPGPLKLAKTYYWRVDESDGFEVYKGQVWSFTTAGAVSGPNPADGTEDIDPSVILTWTAGAVAASHEVYFGTDADAVKNATNASPEYKGPKALGQESYDPGKLSLNTTYYWRIDEVNGINPDSPWAGNVWSFTTGVFFVIDDFEIYDANDNQIWYAWHDGLGYGAPGTDPYFAGNGTGAAVGDETTASYTEETIVHGGNQSMPISYDNNKQGYAYYSEVEHTLTNQRDLGPRDWTEEGVTELSVWFRGNSASVGSFVAGQAGTYTMTAAGADIWNDADEFHYAFKMLTGPGSVQAQVLSVDNTDPWAKAGVMIRETLGAGSKFAAVYITPGNGCRFQARTDTDVDATSDSGVLMTGQTVIIAPYWIKLERDVAGNFRGYYSDNGSTWTSMSWNPQNISMSSNVYIGLAVTSHNNNAVCQVQFSNVTTTGNVGQQWTNQDIGIASNDAEPLYVAVSNSAGAPAVIVHDEPAAAQINAWTEWIIPLTAFTDQGINLTNVDKIAIGLGTRGNIAVPGGSGKMYIDDIRLYRPRDAAE